MTTHWTIVIQDFWAFTWQGRQIAEPLSGCGPWRHRHSSLQVSVHCHHTRTSESPEESSTNKSLSGGRLPKGSVLDWDQETPLLTGLSSGRSPFSSSVPVAGAAEARSSQSPLLLSRMYLSS